MANGEIVFENPWQSRAFGMAKALCDRGLYEWDEFRVYLIAEIGKADAGESGDFQYFDHFLAALQNLLDEKGICRRGEISRTTELFAERPHGHDHDH